MEIRAAGTQTYALIVDNDVTSSSPTTQASQCWPHNTYFLKTSLTEKSELQKETDTERDFHPLVYFPDVSVSDRV